MAIFWIEWTEEDITKIHITRFFLVRLLENLKLHMWFA